MLKSHISDNKYEYSVRRVEELSDLILEKENELKETKGFLNVIKLKLEIKKLYKQIDLYGDEVWQYEMRKFNHVTN